MSHAHSRLGPPRVALLILLSLVGMYPEVQAASSAAQASSGASIEYLARVMDQYHDRFPVYEDVSSAGNHFHALGKIPDETAPVTCNGSDTSGPRSGATAYRCEFSPGALSFGGFYFLNGLLRTGEAAPTPNFGTEPNAGIDLTGATALTFWVRGARGGEKIEFFMGGVGRQPVTGAALQAFPDSTPRQPAFGTVFTLTTQWQKITIDVSGLNLSYVLGGFAWVANAVNNPGGAVFFIDDIQYELGPDRRAARLNEPRFLRSFTTLPVQPNPSDGNAADDIDFTLRNTAFVYDNALALLAFLAHGSTDSLRRARLIGDALVYASQHDRTFTNGQLRSSYAAGDIALPPGWTPNDRAGTVPVSGFFNESPRTFVELQPNAVDTGNNGWAMIALLGLYKRTLAPAYLATARALGEVIRGFRNDTGQYRGFQGGIENPEDPSPARRAFSSVEHNLDVFAAFTTMFQITGEVQWQSDAQHARQFVEAMWDPARGCYLAGADDPNTRNTRLEQLPADVQAWSVLALPDALALHPQLLSCVASNHRTLHDGFVGYDFNEDRDGVWFEGLAHVALSYAVAGHSQLAHTLRQQLRRAQHSAPFGDGEGISAASHDGVTSGFGFALFRRLHVGATAWNVFAQLGFNPYYQTAVASPLLSAKRDFGGDGRVDLLWRHTPTGALALWSMEGATLREGATLQTIGDLRWQVVGTADVDGDGKADVVWRHANGAVAIWLMDGATLRGTGALPAVGDSWQIAALGDLDGDGKADLVWRHTPSGTVAVWLLDGAALRQAVALPAVDLVWEIVALGDLDGDGKADLVWRHASSGAGAVWLMDGATLLQPLAVLAVPDLGWQIVAVGDLDGDGKADFVWRHTPSGIVAVWLMDGATLRLGAPVAAVADLDWQTVGLGDLDGDGKADLVWRHARTGAVAAWLMDGVSLRAGSTVLTVSDSGWQIQ